MIAYIRGELVEKEPTRAVIEAAGVGYEIFLPLSTYESLPRVGEEAKLFVSHCVREDDEILFGFAAPSEKEMFLKLTTVSGVGPKGALAILSGASMSDLSLAIATGNAKRLSAIKGVGKKTAEKICVELKDKVSSLAALAAGDRQPGAQPAVSPAVQDALLALKTLGFAEEKVSRMVSDVMAAHPEATGSQEIIRLALAGGTRAQAR